MYYKRIRSFGEALVGEIVTTRLNEELLMKMDRVVSRGHFRSRSEALRVIVEEYLREHPDLLIGDGVKKLLDEAPQLSDEGLRPWGARIFKGISVTRLVSEGRERP